MSQANICRCLIELDIDGCVHLWSKIQPAHPVPQTRQEVLICLHMARTASASIPLKLRAYSHRWLLDQGYPSQLPDILKPRAERLYPEDVCSVGISVNSKYPVIKEAIYGAMQNAVLEAYADGHEKEPDIVKKRMMEARQKERKGLGL